MNAVRSLMDQLKERDEEAYHRILEEMKPYDLRAAYAEAHALWALGRVENDTLTKLRLYARAQNAFETLKEAMGEKGALMVPIKEAGAELGARVLPELMDAAEMPEFPLTSGHKVVIEEKVHAAISRGNAAKAFAWLEAHGRGAVIKRTLAMPFHAAQEELAAEIRTLVEGFLKQKDIQTIEVVEQKDVHHSTLSAIVREALRDGADIDLDDFGVHQSRITRIVEKK